VSGIPEFCREIEVHLCKKNDGHLIRVVGPSFDLVSAWAQRGIPLKVALAGIDRYFERYYRRGPRRRPVKIDFCEADVLDVFDEWRRATGVTAATGAEAEIIPHSGRHPSLPEHLQRVLTSLTAARASGAIGESFDATVDQVSEALDDVRAKAGGVRGDARRAVLERLIAIDRAMMALARTHLDQKALAAAEREAATELAPFKAAMADDAYARAFNAAVDQLIRASLNLPTVGFEPR
jgi:hypothetical protein